MSGRTPRYHVRQVAPAVDSSTVILLRDVPKSRGGMEALLMRRHPKSNAFAGAHVFPGGKVDDRDRHLPAACWSADNLAAKCEELNAENETVALGFLVAAVRETFEEVGVLLARRRDGSSLTADDLGETSFIRARARLTPRGESWDWSSWLQDQSLVLDLDSLVMWSWWVTPVHRELRFDTRFFLAALPDGQIPQHDRVEATDHLWFTPTNALDSAENGSIDLRKPTAQNLSVLRRYDNARGALDAGRMGNVDRRRVQARVSWQGGELVTSDSIGGQPQTEIPPR